jgi:lysophospholipase L1-like esterase
MAFGAALLMVLIVGCGGGSGGGGDGDTSNTPPVARAGQDRVASALSSVVLDGSSSSDADGQIVSYSWEQTPNGATPVTLSGAQSPIATFTAPDPDTREALVFRLTVTDDDGATSSDEVTITVNLTPSVDAGPNQNIGFSGSSPISITLNGTATDDGEIVAQQWAQVDGDDWTLTNVDNSISGNSVATFTTNAAPATGAYAFSYTVTDEDGAQTSDTVQVNTVAIVFADGFDDGALWTTRWSPENGAADEDWLVNNGKLLQKGYFDEYDESYHTGTYVRLSDPPVNQIPLNYRFSADITPTTNLSGPKQGNDIGVMFRYLDQDNYYRVSMNARFGFTRFEKRKNGIFSTLAVNAIGYVENQPLTMTAEVQDDAVVVWIDGDPVFAIVDDDPIAGGTVALYCQDRAQFDNVTITEASPQPAVVISRPLAYSVALTQDDGDTLAVEAVVLNAPPGASVTISRFTLNDSEEKTAAFTGGYYAAQFSAVPPGEHEIMAALNDLDGNEISSDINSTVGTGGGYWVAVGDSITNGFGDAISSNNESADGRIVAIQGFQSPLADLLTDATGLPQIVFNEGIGSERSSDLLLRIDSILERHPGANGFLLMIGTNDAGFWQVPPATYRANVEGTVVKIDNQQGKPVWLAELMPRYEDDVQWTLDASGNALIGQYNTILRQIAGSDPNDRSLLGPNFYRGAFLTSPAQVYNDIIHPNDAGYQLMAEGWLDALNQD